MPKESLSGLWFLLICFLMGFCCVTFICPGARARTGEYIPPRAVSITKADLSTPSPLKSTIEEWRILHILWFSVKDKPLGMKRWCNEIPQLITDQMFGSLVKEMGLLGEVPVDLSIDRGGLWITAWVRSVGFIPHPQLMLSQLLLFIWFHWFCILCGGLHASVHARFIAFISN